MARARQSAAIRFLTFALLIFAAGFAQSHAIGTVDVDVQGILDNVTATWGAVKTVLLSILGFIILLRIALMGLRKING